MEKKAKILVIDDDPDFVEAVKVILGRYDVVSAPDAQKGLELVSSEKPDLVLLDIMMDSMYDGFSVCHRIKTSAEESTRSIPVIQISAVKAESGSRFGFAGVEEGMRGPDDYLDKPVEADVLIERIERLLGK